LSEAHPIAILCCRDGDVELCAEGTVALLRDRDNPIAQCPRQGKEVCCSDQPAVTVLSGPDQDLLLHGLQHHHGSVEQLGDSLLSGANLIETLKRDGLYVGLSTCTAYGVELAKLVTQALRGRLGFDDVLGDNMELALHEALVNGLIHGNLGIPSTGRETLEMFSDYCRAVEKGLADNDRGSRLIEVFAWWGEHSIDISVEDDGEGFDPSTLNANAVNGRTSGRGLQLIGSLADGGYRITQGGRRLTMRFRR